MREIAAPFANDRIDCVRGTEARGFIFGTAVAYQLGVGFVPLRKPGKLPGRVIGRSYTLEYGTDRIEMHENVLGRGDRVLLIDDLIATGKALNPSIEKFDDSCFTGEYVSGVGAEYLEGLAAGGGRGTTASTCGQRVSTT